MRQAWYDKQGGTPKDLKDKLKSDEEKLGHMPFAYFCAADHPNTKEFASKVIALLAAVLCSGLGDEWVMEDIDSLPPYGTLLKTDRAEYEELRLIRNWIAQGRFDLRENRRKIDCERLDPVTLMKCLFNRSCGPE
ncbi:hypothetical protein PtrCC142_010824 [Pyrenophora tritici-repentis]|nr:hypothetical protein Alg215_10854 [Pyrenophora tritici-repentis]KAI1525072.1 hypothetical protein PtrSN001C_010789 [Pyrenophora tritici-repentis]KAI1560729.1 hypothetical protein PtrEW7m1_011468 [Pyrenophora tritici-repentis]KAI1561598.1 hypothetical protein PtrEW4_010505 [Pyrenophora tritici-repentis]KAI1573253.1 hypothetical protein PtrEW13061_011182 [Pyrenophora tritici-repentis]